MELKLQMKTIKNIALAVAGIVGAINKSNKELIDSLQIHEQL